MLQVSASWRTKHLPGLLRKAERHGTGRASIEVEQSTTGEVSVTGPTGKFAARSGEGVRAELPGADSQQAGLGRLSSM